MADGELRFNTKIDTKGMESGLKSVATSVGTVFKGIGTAVGVAMTAVGALTAKVVSSYAEYEQMVGGVDTLFKESSAKVQEYANNAYATAGLSATEYMSTVTGFSASLLQSLGGDTEKSADYANMAITDMADNANKMGTSIESIQYAYQGFAKQNYTMLDNLKLGYGGTKEEMERLLEDASKISGVKYDISSYADVVDAIHIMQTEMGIAEATANEAKTTISGSANAMKASFQNLLTGLAQGGDNLDELLNNFFDSFSTFMGNVLPVVQRVMDNLPPVIAKFAEQLPQIIADFLPSIMQGAMALISGIVSNIGVIVDGISDAISVVLESMGDSDSLVEGVFEFVKAIAQLVIDNLPLLIETFVGLIQSIADYFSENTDDLVNIILTLTQTIIDTIISNLPQFISAGIELIGALAIGLIGAIPTLLSQLVTGLTDMLSTVGTDIWNNVVELGGNIVKGLWEGIKGLGNWIGEKVGGFFNGIVGGAKKLLGINSPSKVFAKLGEYSAMGYGKGITDELDKIKPSIDASFGGVVADVAGGNTNNITQNFYSQTTSPYDAYRRVVLNAL